MPKIGKKCFVVLASLGAILTIIVSLMIASLLETGLVDLIVNGIMIRWGSKSFVTILMGIIVYSICIGYAYVIHFKGHEDR